MRGVDKVNVDTFPPFPSHFVPSRPHLTAMFVLDYWENKSHIMHDLRTILINHSLAVNHQRKVVKCTLGGDIVGRGGKSFTICGDFGLICGVYVVPDTALSWVKKAMAEVIERHKSAGMTWYNTILLPISLFFSSQLLCLLVLFVCLIIIISLFQ